MVRPRIIPSDWSILMSDPLIGPYWCLTLALIYINTRQQGLRLLFLLLLIMSQSWYAEGNGGGGRRGERGNMYSMLIHPPVFLICTGSRRVHNLNIVCLRMLWIRDILVRIRIRGFELQTNGSGSGSCYFRHWPSRSKQKTISAYYFL